MALRLLNYEWIDSAVARIVGAGRQAPLSAVAPATALCRNNRTMLPIGAMEIRVLLPAGLGYAVEVQLPEGGFHVDHLATLRIKSPGFCAPSTNERS